MTEVGTQSPERLIQLLGDPASFRHRPDSVELMQTHISFVAMAPPWVYKVKKALDLGFLDFTTLEKRRFFCEEEVRLNRRLCESVYRGILPILQDPQAPSGLRIGTEAELDAPGVVEFAVLMRQLEDGYFMQQLIGAGDFSEADLERVVRTLTRFYQAHPSTSETSAWGSVDRIRVSVDENFEQTRDYVGRLLSPAAFALLRDDAERFLTNEGELLARRVEGGMIRDCHGDLHLDHVHITPDRVCIYDCIEFSERLRYIDVASDVAFLAMDLDHSRHSGLAARFAALMTTAMDDPDMLRLLPFYKTYRAIVRAKVAGMRSQEPEVPESVRAEATAEARAYYRLATRYVVTGDRPTVLLVMGRVATGKSTQARMLGEALGWPVLSSDETRKRMAGLPLLERADDGTRAHLYSREVSRAVYDELMDAAAAVVRAGRGAVLDATFSRRTDRDLLRRILAATESPTGHSVVCRVVELVAPDGVLEGRLRRRESDPGVISDARLADFEAISAGYEAPSLGEDPQRVTVTSSADPEATHHEVLLGLVQKRGDSA